MQYNAKYFNFYYDVIHCNVQGGIHRYLEEYPEGGLFKGKNFVFDGRVSVPSVSLQDLPTAMENSVPCQETDVASNMMDAHQNSGISEAAIDDIKGEGAILCGWVSCCDSD